MRYGPIILIEDDADDIEVFQDVLKELKVDHPLAFFENSQLAKEFLLTHPVKPFLIICDINLPRQNGLQFKREIDNDPVLKKKSIPFIFYSTSNDQKTINDAYTEFSVQGYFQKTDTMAEIKETWRVVLNYWMRCKHPDIKSL